MPGFQGVPAVEQRLAGRPGGGGQRQQREGRADPVLVPHHVAHRVPERLLGPEQEAAAGFALPGPDYPLEPGQRLGVTGPRGRGDLPEERG